MFGRFGSKTFPSLGREGDRHVLKIDEGTE
jgi:hypothetical protein